MAQLGDAIVLTKGAAIETTAMFGATLGGTLVRELGEDVARAADRLFCRLSVVEDALTAVEVGVRERGVTCMHDATERGVYGGLCEIAEAADVGMVIDEPAIPLRPEVEAVCRHFGIDPYVTSSEGTLLATVRPHALSDVLQRLDSCGIPAAHIGEVTPADQGVRVVRGGREEPLAAPTEDPFWPAYVAALEAAP
jgi:hydrogenase maturation factor